MKLLEYEGKEIFGRYGIPLQKRCGVIRLGDSTDKLVLDGPGPWVVKAQVLAGGRGKAGGVKLAKTPTEARELALKMLGMKMVTHQTQGKALIVEEVLVDEACDIKREIYISVVLDRKGSTPTIIASAEGGMSIEELAQSHPEKIIKLPVDVEAGLLDFQARQLAFDLNIPQKNFREFTAFACRLVRAFIEEDASLVEVNPLVITGDDRLIALDSKIVTDDNALFRHKDLAAKPDHEATEIEKEAKEIGINYIGLDGDIGCMVNGAGLAMATLDTVKMAGGDAANFLDVGGGANVDQITRAFQIILKDSKVKAVLVNIFGGIMKCDNIASGVVEASKKVKINIPLIVRLEGTNVKEGREILAKSGLKLEQASSLWEAAQKAVAAAK
ncbi:MAG: ADP-forming succinate--CoA ligase subunit beta [Elusimicrobia bacterium CG_4_10_14_0_2_um_filter_56_8]|nr:MAG: succinate--CoA ligase subunit beta [Elusimicrobia bacterium CG1_02_56_21]PJA15212.1 MAG: ADP-forming succinate--CoA ligase subunit beta [Elusimicrobia bacterium CG_4_10_14_0_2_um_filter_56_8]